MISRLTLLLFVFALGFVACEDDLLSIDRSFAANGVTFDIPASDEPGTVSVSENDIDVDLRGQLEEYGISEDRLQEVTLESATVTINDPSGELTFDDITDAAINISAEGQSATEVASIDDAATGTTATLTVRDSDIKAYLLASTISLELSATSADAVGEDVTITVVPTYNVVGGL